MKLRPDIPLWLHLLSRIGLRHWRNQVWRTFFLVMLLSLGVGVFLSIRLASRAAVTSFQNFTESVTGEVDFVVQSKAGALGLDDLRGVRQSLGSLPVQILPIAELNLLSEAPSGQRETFRITGLDLVAIQNLPSVQERENRILFQPLEPGDETPSIFSTLRQRGGFFAHPARIAEFGWTPGQPVQFTLQGQPRELTLLGAFPVENASTPPSPNLLLADIAQVLRLQEGPPGFDQIWLRVEEGHDRNQILSQLPDLIESRHPNLWVQESATSRRSGEIMTQAFRFNLTILSLIALLVGFYLMLQALEAAVVYRRRELAVLRSLGTESADIQRAWLAEALALGLLGSLGGLLVGWLGAYASVGAITQTVETLYEAGGGSDLSLRPSDILWALVLGLGTAFLAGWLPSREAAATPPAQIFQEGRKDPGFILFRRPLLSLLLFLSGFALMLIPGVPLEGGGQFPFAGYLAAFAWLVGGSGLLAVGLRPLGELLHRLPGSPWMMMAGSRLRDATGRHKLAVAGLFVAVAMATGMTLLINSFESTVRSWIGQSLPADIYVLSTLSTRADAGSPLDRSLVSEIENHPEVESTGGLRLFPVLINGLRTQVGGTNLEGSLRDGRLIWLRRPPADTQFDESTRPRGVVSESFAQRFNLSLGESLELPTPAGFQTVEIVGIYADYGNERGTLLVSLSLLQDWFADDRITSLAVYLKPGSDAAALSRQWQEAFPFLSIQTQEGLRDEVLTVFRQTFAITYALQIIAVVVAMAGLGLGMLSILGESRRDLEILQALGAVRADTARLAAWEGFGLTLAGVTGGLGVGFLLGALLTFVINKQSFGWTLQFDIPWPTLVLTIVLTLLSGLLTSAAIGWKSNT